MGHSLRAALLAVTLVVASIMFGSPSIAGEDMVKLSVPDMTCAACPITVRKSLEAVDGVILAEVSYEELTAEVTYDPSITDTTELIKATTNVGYPSYVIE